MCVLFAGGNNWRTPGCEARPVRVQETRAVRAGRRDVPRPRVTRRRQRSIRTRLSAEVAEIRRPPQARGVQEEPGRRRDRGRLW